MDPIARLARLEELRRSGLPVGPESLSDGLEGADTPIAEDPEMSDEDKEAMFQRQANRIKTDDYRRERMMYRAAKATGTPVEELMQQPEWSGVGDARADDAVMPMQARAAMAQKRMDGEAERMDRWKSQMLLASSNSRANMSNAFGMLSPEQQQSVIMSRFMPNGGYVDPRVQVATLEAQARERIYERQAALERDRLAQEKALADRRAGQDDTRLDDARKGAEDDLGFKRDGLKSAEKTATDSRSSDWWKFVTQLGAQAFLQNAAGQQRLSEIDRTAAVKNPMQGPAADLATLQADKLRTEAAQAAVQWADEHVGSNYAWDKGVKDYIGLGGTTQFTADEQAAALAALQAQFPQMKPEQAAQIIRSIAARKNSDPSPF